MNIKNFIIGVIIIMVVIGCVYLYTNSIQENKIALNTQNAQKERYFFGSCK